MRGGAIEHGTSPNTQKKIIKVPKVVNGIDTLVEIEVDDTGGPVLGAARRPIPCSIMISGAWMAMPR